MHAIRDFEPVAAGVCVCVAVSILFSPSPADAQWIDGGAPICTAAENQDDPVIVTDGAGGAIIAWSHMNTSRDIHAQRINADGVVLWTADGVEVCGAAGVQNGQQMIDDGGGGAFLVWQDFRSGYSDIFAQRIDIGGNILWATGGVPVCTAGDNQLYPAIVSDGGGGAVIVWSDFRNGEDSDIYAQRIDADGDALWPAAGVPVATLEFYEEIFPKPVSDGAGGAIIVWNSYPEYGPFHNYCARVDARGNIAWTMSLMGFSNQFEPSIAYCPGGAIIAWNEAYDTHFDIRAQKVDTSGVKQWYAGDIPVCAAPGSQFNSQIIPDGSGGAIVAWHDERSGDCDIYARRLDADGDTLWATFGTAVCTSAGAQDFVTLAGDGSGGAIIAWRDGRGADTDIYVQSVDANGNVRWTADGIPLCTETEDQRVPCIVEKGAGCAIIAWEDHRPASFPDIYAQQVEWDGTTETELLSWAASVEGTAVWIGWTLSVLDEGAVFTLRRSTAKDHGFSELEDAGIVRDGLDFTTVDMGCEPGGAYIYRVTVGGPSGERVLFETDLVSIPPMPFTLFQNSPNPFNPSTTIRYYIPERTDVAIEIFNAAGRLVEMLAGGEKQRGYHEVVWSAGGIGSGVYFCRLTAGKAKMSRKMILMR